MDRGCRGKIVGVLFSILANPDAVSPLIPGWRVRYLVRFPTALLDTLVPGTEENVERRRALHHHHLLGGELELIEWQHDCPRFAVHFGRCGLVELPRTRRAFFFMRRGYSG